MTTKAFIELTKEKDLGKTFDFTAKVEMIKQTSGPTLMVLSDGTANFTFKAFLKPGARAYPEVEIGDIVHVTAQINERNSDIEGEVIGLKKASITDAETFLTAIQEIKNKRYAPTNTTFSIKSKVLESLKTRFIDVATVIRKAVIDGKPILLRHNADCDGYSSAVTIERAIIGLMNDISGGDVMLQYQNYRRAPSKAPFYEYEDAVKDLATWMRDKVKNGAQAPLIIITDNGSTDEDIIAIKQMKIYDCPIVVVDHHFPGKITNGKVEVDKYLEAHINPYLEGFDSNVSAGMLGYELARFIYENNNSVLIPATAAILDHTEGEEREQYVAQAKALGFTEDYMQNLGEIIDMQSHYLRFSEAREFVNDLFGANMEAQKRIVEMLSPELKRRYDTVWNIAKHYAKVEDLGPFFVVEFDGEKGTQRGEYPAIGKSTNHVHKMFESTLSKPVVTMTTGPTFITVRVSDAVKGFSVNDFVNEVYDTKNFTAVDGGGHEHAGSIKFVEYGKEEMIGAFKDYLKRVSQKNH